MVKQIKSKLLSFVKGKSVQLSFQQWKEQKGKKLEDSFPGIKFVEVSVKVPEKMVVDLWDPWKLQKKGKVEIKPEELLSGGVLTSIYKEVEVVGVIGSSHIDGAKCLDTAAIKKEYKGKVYYTPVKDIQVFVDKLSQKDKKEYYKLKEGSIVSLKCVPVVVAKKRTQKVDISFSLWKDLKVY